MLSRRGLLLSAGAALAVLGAGAVAARLPPAGPGLRVLSAEEAARCEAFGDALFPPDSPLGVSASAVGLGGRVDRLCSQVFEPEVVMAFRLALRTLEYATVVTEGATFSALPLARRRALLRDWSTPDPLPRRLLLDLLRMALGIAFFNAPQAREAVGAQPACGSTEEDA